MFTYKLKWLLRVIWFNINPFYEFKMKVTYKPLTASLIDDLLIRELGKCGLHYGGGGTDFYSRDLYFYGTKFAIKRAIKRFDDIQSFCSGVEIYQLNDIEDSHFLGTYY
jgi:hypothetical protein